MKNFILRHCSNRMHLTGKIIVSLMMLSTLFFFSFAGPSPAGSTEEKTKVSIAAFKGDAAGAYTIIHDDFGGHWASGIEDYADTVAYSRGIPFCFALIAGQCDVNDWKRASALVAHGHQVVNHSMNHKCGRETDWCKAGVWNEKDFHLEIDSAARQIMQHTGKHPAFFMFPFDIHTDTMIAYLRKEGYCGARAGTSGMMEHIPVNDPFHLNYKAFAPGEAATGLDSFAAEAVKQKAWAIREVHGVEDGSWAAIPLKDYQEHMNYLQRISGAGQLWVATLSDVVLYNLMKQLYTAEVSGAGKDKKSYEIKFIPLTGSKALKDSKMYKTAKATSSLKGLTLVLTMEGNKGVRVTQKGKHIPVKAAQDKFIFEADPEAGPVAVAYN